MALRLLAVMAMVLSFLFCNEVSPVLGDVGTATSYNPPYTPTRCNGNSPYQFPGGNLFVAVSEGLWNNGAACGRLYRLRCLSENNRACKNMDTIDVGVVDLCRKSPCPSTMVMSTDAFAAISHSPQSKISIEFIRASVTSKKDPLLNSHRQWHVGIVEIRLSDPMLLSFSTSSSSS